MIYSNPQEVLAEVFNLYSVPVDVFEFEEMRDNGDKCRRWFITSNHVRESCLIQHTCLPPVSAWFSRLLQPMIIYRIYIALQARASGENLNYVTLAPQARQARASGKI